MCQCTYEKKDRVCAKITAHTLYIWSGVLLLLWGFKLLQSPAKLVGARGGLASATHSVQAADDLLGLHTDDKAGQPLCVAVTSTMEDTLANASVRPCSHLYVLTAGAAGFIENLTVSDTFVANDV